jgi:WD40 repeat protein
MLLKLIFRSLLGLLLVCCLCLGLAVTLGRAAGEGMLAMWAMMDYGSDYDIYLVDARTQIAFNLTRHPELDRGFDWSPDGTQFAYAQRRDQSYTVRIVDSQGRIINQTAIEFALTTLVWSPDGKYLAALSENNEIYLGDVTTHKWRNISQTQLLAEKGMSWSPDGTQLVYTLNENSIWVMTPTTGERRRLVDISRYSVPRWSPDGTRLAYVRWNGDVCIYDLRDATVTILSEAQQARTPILWSHDGQHVVFVAQTEAGFVLRQITVATGTALDQALPFDRISGLIWSPDERAFVVSAAETAAANTESLYVIDRASGVGTRVTGADIFARNALWQPD